MNESKAPRAAGSPLHETATDEVIDLVDVVSPAPGDPDVAPLELVDVVHRPEGADRLSALELTDVISPASTEAADTAVLPAAESQDIFAGDTEQEMAIEDVSIDAASPDEQEDLVDFMAEETPAEVAPPDIPALSTGEEELLELSDDVQDIFYPDAPPATGTPTEEDLFVDKDAQELMDLDDVFDEELEKTLEQEDDDLTNTLGLNLDPASLSETFPDLRMDDLRQITKSPVLPQAIDPQQLDAAIEAALDRKLGERIDKAVEAIIREAVIKEMARIRQTILEGTETGG